MAQAYSPHCIMVAGGWAEEEKGKWSHFHSLKCLHEEPLDDTSCDACAHLETSQVGPHWITTQPYEVSSVADAW